MSRAAHDTPLGAILKGAAAGIVGTIAMDLVWYLRYRSDGGAASFADWELSGVDDYEIAPAPAQVGKRVIEGLFETELDATTAGPMNNIVHWATGAGWGVSHGIINGSMSKTRALAGLATGAAAWVTSYATLAPAGIYEPMWEYDLKTLWKDLSAHLAFGLTTGIAYKLLSRTKTD